VVGNLLREFVSDRSFDCMRCPGVQRGGIDAVGEQEGD
jgi:hypothetical protein